MSRSTESQLAEVADGAVGEIDAEVIAVLRTRRRRDRVVVLEQRRHELMRLAAVKSVPALKAAPARPGVARRGRVGLVLGREVPLADGHRHVAVRGEDLGHEAVLARHSSPVAREADGEIGDSPHRVRVVVAAREQAGARSASTATWCGSWRAAPRPRPGVDVRRGDVGAVAPELGVADVVEHDDQHVRRTLGCRRLRRPPRRRLPPTRTDDPTELDHVASMSRLCAVCMPHSSRARARRART